MSLKLAWIFMDIEDEFFIKTLQKPLNPPTIKNLIDTTYNTFTSTIDQSINDLQEYHNNKGVNNKLTRKEFKNLRNRYPFLNTGMFGKIPKKYKTIQLILKQFQQKKSKYENRKNVKNKIIEIIKNRIGKRIILEEHDLIKDLGLD